MCNFREIDAGIVNIFFFKIIRRKFFNEKVFPQEFHLSDKKLKCFRTRVLLFQFHNPPMSFKMPKLSCTNKKLAHFSLIIFISCLYHGRSCTETKKKKMFRYPSHEWKPLGYLYCMMEENIKNSSQKKEHKKRAEKKLHSVFRFFTTLKR